MTSKTQSKLITNVVGSIVELHGPCKAVIGFNYKGQFERALLWSDRLVVDGAILPTGSLISSHVSFGTKVIFNCHSYLQSGKDSCTWFVTTACVSKAEDENYESLHLSGLPLINGIVNKCGTIIEVGRRQVIVTYQEDGEDYESKVLVLGSKFFAFGRRLNSKIDMESLLFVEEKIWFDAVPFDGEYSWFATVAWKGTKPRTSYDFIPHITLKEINLTEYKDVINNPYGKFLCGKGKVLTVINKEYGVALATVKQYNWQTILFHRSCSYLFGTKLKSADLRNIFRAGDRIKFVATPAGPNVGVQWIARQLLIDTTHFNIDYL